uniref:Neuromedin-S n=1 Tax=Phocoena sinus TaxID=42100 RepID=A0A8C9BSI6_PHOSS
MKHLLAQFPSILAIYCFCLLQIPSSGKGTPSTDPSWPDKIPCDLPSSFSFQDNQDIYKRFLFHYSRTQKPTHPVKAGFPPVHSLMHLAAKLANQRMKRFWQRVRTFSFHHIFIDALGRHYFVSVLPDASPGAICPWRFAFWLRGPQASCADLGRGAASVLLQVDRAP